MATNRQNNVGNFADVGPNRTSQIVTTIIPAGARFPVFQAGDEFYLVVATGQVTIKPNNGSENTFVQGTGLRVNSQNIFANVQIFNPNTYSVVIQIFVGFGGYIDNRLIIFDPNNITVSYPTYPVPNVAGSILIPDKSGQPITDQNGNKFLALGRQAIYISNLTLADAYDLSRSNPALPGAALTVQPLTSIVYPASGDFSMHIPSGNLNAIVSELYSAIRQT